MWEAEEWSNRWERPAGQGDLCLTTHLQQKGLLRTEQVPMKVQVWGHQRVPGGCHL